MKSLWRTLRQLFDVMPSGAKPFYVWYSIVTGALAILDTAALGLIVLVVTPLATGGPVTLPLIGELPEEATVWIVLLVCFLFVLKGVLAILLHWVATRRFARYELEIGNRLFHSYAHAQWEDRSKLSTAEVTRIVDISMANTNLGFILPLSQVPGNLLTFISVLAVLVASQPLTALIALVYLLLISFLLLVVVTKRVRTAGAHNRKFGYLVARIMTEMVDALKEITLRGKIDEVGKVISQNRQRATRARANMAFLSVIPKYAFEAALIGGFLLVGGAAYLFNGPEAAIVSVSLFAATGFRMIPAMNAVQSAFNSASANEVYARDVVRFLKEAEASQAAADETTEDSAVLPDNPRALNLKSVDFVYPGSEEAVLRGANLEIPFGSSLAVVGPSGAGKSTLIDMVLGLSRPSEGKIEIDGLELESVVRQWRSRVGYVPQRVTLFDASIAQNVALTWSDDFDAERVTWALERAQLGELLERPQGIHAVVGERGSSISGGQQQRLGIARALYTDPLVLVLDEATSALDTATENRVSQAMRSLQGEVTFVTIAHRLATIRDYDQVCYMESGMIRGLGSFDELVATVPEFAHQARLAGLVERK
ncbi:ABC transporter ATP-binding protein [Leucobacter alluvii]|uniref:ABC transporter ATP-binding protein n=1 Tax=Leucobacter alluvii TaxID=340321 RepID=A0ABN3B778_9MICO